MAFFEVVEPLFFTSEDGRNAPECVVGMNRNDRPGARNRQLNKDRPLDRRINRSVDEGRRIPFLGINKDSQDWAAWYLIFDLLSPEQPDYPLNKTANTAITDLTHTF